MIDPWRLQGVQIPQHERTGEARVHQGDRLLPHADLRRAQLLPAARWAPESPGKAQALACLNLGYLGEPNCKYKPGRLLRVHMLRGMLRGCTRPLVVLTPLSLACCVHSDYQKAAAISHVLKWVESGVGGFTHPLRTWKYACVQGCW